MSNDVNSNDFNSRLDKVMDTLDNDPNFGADEDTTPDAADPAGAGNAEPPAKDAIGEGQDKTNDADKAKPSDDTQPVAIEPPTSWPTDDKEAFKSLPTWAQERIVAREHEREAHFSERSRTIATREQEINTLQNQAQQAQQQYAGELQRLSQLAQQLMPAKFNDIQTDADYLRLKTEDPARASEYEAFVHVLRNSQAQAQQVATQRQQAHLDNEWTTLQNKFPEFKDATKAQTLISEVRKAAVDYYGFSPQEVEVIADHRHVPIIRDAIAWRNHLATLRAAESKKVPAAPSSPALRANANAGKANVGTEQSRQILNRASKESDLRRKADLIAGMLT